MKKVALVGGGVGGLTAALLLTRAGFQVTVYEKADRLGGRLRYVERDGFRVDQGPTIVLLPDMIRGILEEGGLSGEALAFERIDPLYRITYPDGTAFHKWQNRERQLEELARVFPGEEESYDRYMGEMKQRFEKGRKAFLEQSFQRKRDFWTLGNLALLGRLKAHSSVRRDSGTFFRDPRLRDAFSFQTLYIGGNPAATPALYSLVPYSEHEHGVWYLQGGYAGLVDLLEKELRSRGTAIHCGTEVEGVWTEKGECLGVIAEGENLRYDRVVLNGEFPGTWGLLGEDERRRKRAASKRYVPSSGCFLMYLGLGKVYREQPVHQFLFSRDFDGMLEDIFVNKRLPKDPSVYAFNPSVIDSSLAPEGKSVLYTLVPVPSGSHLPWEELKGRLVKETLERLERSAFPGLRESVEWLEVRSPQEAMADGLYEGGSFGIGPVLGQSGVFRPQHSPYGLRNLHAVGASVHPGGGVPIVMQGAKLLADHLIRQ